MAFTLLQNVNRQVEMKRPVRRPIKIVMYERFYEDEKRKESKIYNCFFMTDLFFYFTSYCKKENVLKYLNI